RDGDGGPAAEGRGNTHPERQRPGGGLPHRAAREDRPIRAPVIAERDTTDDDGCHEIPSARDVRLPPIDQLEIRRAAPLTSFVSSMTVTGQRPTPSASRHSDGDSAAIWKNVSVTPNECIESWRRADAITTASSRRLVNAPTFQKMCVALRAANARNSSQ